MHSRGVVLLAIATGGLLTAAVLPFAGAPLGASEALLFVAIPCGIAGLIRRYARD